MPSEVQRTVLERLARGPATLADLRSAFAAERAEARALPSMGEEDPFAAEVVALIRDGAVVERDGRYRLGEERAGGS